MGSRTGRTSGGGRVVVGPFTLRLWFMRVAVVVEAERWVIVERRVGVGGCLWKEWILLWYTCTLYTCLVTYRGAARRPHDLVIIEWRRKYGRTKSGQVNMYVYISP